MAEINLYFPTPIYVETNLFGEKENKVMSDRVLELQKIVKSGGLEWEGGTYTTHSTFNLLNDKVFHPLLDTVQHHINEFTKAHNSNYLHRCNSAWANINQPGTYQEYHSHPSSVFSCVYYPHVPENSGDIVFESPHVPDMFPVINITQMNDLTLERINYKPKSGTLLIFRSYLRHCVRGGTNTEPRISIALNYA
jgi:uncharacterized protein (TIGR02466 family)